MSYPTIHAWDDRFRKGDILPKLVAVYGSPRRKGNTSTLLDRAIKGAEDAGARVDTVILPDATMSPCLEIYGCKKAGRCVIQDDFQNIIETILASEGLMLASPVFFYAVSSHTKILIDRCQSLWVKKYWIDQVPYGKWKPKRKGLFISAGATKGERLFDGPLLTIKYFFDVLDMKLVKALLYRGLDFEGDVLKHPEFLEEAYKAGNDLTLALNT